MNCVRTTYTAKRTLRELFHSGKLKALIVLAPSHLQSAFFRYILLVSFRFSYVFFYVSSALPSDLPFLFDFLKSCAGALPLRDCIVFLSICIFNSLFVHMFSLVFPPSVLVLLGNYGLG